MQEPDIGDGQWGQTFAGACHEAQDNTGAELRSICLCNTGPDRACSVADERDDIGGSTTKFVDEWHPEEVTDSLDISKETTTGGRTCTNAVVVKK